MKAALLKDVKEMVVEEYPIRNLKSNEVLIKVTNCGICGTDKHIFEGSAPSTKPIILGHEYSGIVIDKTKNSEFKIGQKVVIDPNISCGRCYYCRKGDVNYCQNLNALGVTLNGGLAEFSIVPESQIYILPPNFDLSIAAFAEPLSCCLRGMYHAQIVQGENVVIIGGGSIGLLFVQLAKFAGASNILLIEPIELKRNLALGLGADYVFDPNRENFIETYNEITKKKINIIIECVGSKTTVELSIKLASKGTRIVIFGLAPKDQNIEINLQELFQNELKLVSSLLNPFTFENAVKLLVNDKIVVKNLISKKLSLENVPNVISNSNSQFVKYQIINNFKEVA